MNKKVVVGMSGGVDSSVAAYLLKEQGYTVMGVTMQMWGDNVPSDCSNAGAINGEDTASAYISTNNGSNTATTYISTDSGSVTAAASGISVTSDAVSDARRVAKELGIEHHVIDFRNEFKQNVIDYFVDEYKNGRTPNPCVVCNRKVKWEALLKWGEAYGADYVATGHYARITKLDNGRYAVRNCVSAKKDQTYALYNLTQEQLARTLMPLGEYSKDEIRNIAAKLGIAVSDKPDSMEICFIPDNDYAGYIKNTAGYEYSPGNFIDTKGNVIGRHKGIIHYTVGQRKGLGISMGRPVFVTQINPDTNEVVIGDDSDVFSSKLCADRINLMGISAIEDGMRATAKIRYSHNGAACTLKMLDKDLLECTFDKPQRAVTPGQALVLYQNDYVIGGGTII